MTATAAAAQDGAGAANIPEVVAQNGKASNANSAANADQPVNAGLEIAGGYNDNVYATRNREQGDFYLVAQPFVRADLGSGGTTATLRAEGEIGRYAELTSENYNDWLLAADARARLNQDLSLVGGAEWRWDHEARTSPEAVSGLEPTRYQRGFGYLGLIANSGDFSGRLASTLKRYAFSDVPGASGTINNHDRNRLQGEIGARAGYSLRSGTELFVQGAYDWRDYDDALDDFGYARNSDGFSLVAGVLATNSAGLFTANYKGYSLPNSYLDSGSNVYYFEDSSITACTGANFNGFYCPASPLVLSPTLVGTNGSSASGQFTLYNAQTQPAATSNVIPGIGVNPGALNFPYPITKSFDFGLPFFLGRNIYTAIEGRSAGPTVGPYVAF